MGRKSGLARDTLLTVPTEPPAAFVDRALDPVPDPKPAGPAAWDAGAAGVVAACELAVPPHAASPSPTTGTISPTATPRPRFLTRRRRSPARPWCCCLVATERRRPVSLWFLIMLALQSFRWTV